ncbi:glycosyltransferase [Yimella sp. NH-Cas1]|uniref:glycosyltransferase n=1 Tax=Yimella sp. NH-Cas1 TaxID=2917726 RepID=UPI001EFBD3A7|nr:glycosyltransferase [Yimella sp. NH-Cas1]
MLTSDADGSLLVTDDDGPRLNVTTMLVVREGGERLHATLRALLDQRRRPDRLVIIDTTPERSTHRIPDEHPQIRAGFPDVSVVTVPPGSSFADTVDIAVEALPDPGEDAVVTKRSRTRADKRPIRPRDRHEWLWLLHEDNQPDANALAALTEAVGRTTRIGIAGCKVRELDRPRRLVDVGLDVTRTGRHIGEQMQGEFDQGQHDLRTDVLAVSSSGLMIRRDVYATLGGFDPAFDGDGDGLDLCWRAHLTGHQVVVVTDAIVHQDVAPTPSDGTGKQRPDPDLPAPQSPRTLRRHRQVALARASLLGWPLMSLWILLSGLVLGVGMLLVKHPRRALAEFAQATAPFGLGRIVGARARFFGRATARRRYLRPLFVGAGAAWMSARDSLRAAVTLDDVPPEHALVDEGAGETGPVDEHAQALAVPRRPLAQMWRSPGLWTVLAALIAAGVQWRGLLGSHSFQGRSGAISGGELRAFGTDSGGIWRLYRDGWTGAGLGGPNQHAEYLPVLWPLAWLVEHVPGLASATSGHTAVVWLLALTMPLSALTAYRAGRVLTPHGWPRAVVAALWASSALATTASAQGRLGPAIGHVLAPLVFAGVVAIARPRGSATMTFATVAVAGIMGAFSPILLAFSTIAALLVALFGARWARLRGLILATVPWALLGAYTRDLLSDPRQIFAGPGNLITGAPTQAEPWQLALLHPGGPGSYPVLLGLPLLVLAVLGLCSPGRHRFMLAASALALTALTGALLSPSLVVMSTPDGPRTAWAGVPLQVFALCCAGIALAGLAPPYPRSKPARAVLHPAMGVLAGVLAAVVVGFAAWAGQVTALRPVDRPLPELVQKQFTGPRSIRSLVLTVGRDGTVAYRLQGREVGRPVADLTLPAPSGAADAGRAVDALVRGQGEAAAAGLHRLAVGYVVLTGPGAAGSDVSSSLQSGGSLLRMHSVRDAQVWRVAPMTTPAGDRSVASSRLVLLTAGTPTQELRTDDWHAATSLRLPAARVARTIVVAEPGGWSSRAEVTYDGKPLRAEVVGPTVQYELPTAAGQLEIAPRPAFERTRWAQAGLWLLVVFIALPFGNRASRRRAW